ncbi:hypothetical protein SAMN02745824_2818 [Parasphingorhabdus marina DSM 22363]|uniref:Uncharacterized protein n=1 Tax=Parasphingorhabdus marina DSM 22363 TaxID=1123272 RepID=A0A1N6GGK4_9SPHN|nr:hypothetical protein [Parasphingorhabdus marina]SIO06601.1 hypothetical protein SAMN02745824_2818 [Parasphingorhabdus marina DSM 22363]
MKSTVEVPVENVRDLFQLMEKMNDLFHQPRNLKDGKRIARFADENYPSIHKAYYEILWNLLPEEDRKTIENA